jgi:hypothetical protein
MTITVTKARFAQGYSSCDHLLEDAGMSAVVGRTYPSLWAAAKAAKAAAGTQDRRCGSPPVWIYWEDSSGREIGQKVWP